VLQIECEGQQITRGDVQRDAACGCARAVARQLVGVDLREAVAQAGLFHHYYPCLATMGADPGLGRSLVQAAGDLMRQAVEVAIEQRTYSSALSETAHPGTGGYAEGGRGGKTDGTF
jgi:hypothetical protein